MVKNTKQPSQNNQKVNINLSDETKSFSEQIDEIRRITEENLRYTKTLKQSSSQSKTPQVVAQKELQKLLQENLKVSKELFEMTSKIKRWVTMQRIFGVIKILIIIIPLTLGAIYLPPLLKKAIEPYQQLLNIGQNLPGQNILDQFIGQGEQPEGALIENE